MEQQPEQTEKIAYETPALQDFNFGLTVAEGWSGFDCPPRRPLYEDDYGTGDMGNL